MNDLFHSFSSLVSRDKFSFSANYNAAGMTIPGSTDVSFAPMTGQLDELRFYNKTLPDAFIKALYNLGKAGK